MNRKSFIALLGGIIAAPFVSLGALFKEKRRHILTKIKFHHLSKNARNQIIIHSNSDSTFPFDVLSDSPKVLNRYQQIIKEPDVNVTCNTYVYDSYKKISPNTLLFTNLKETNYISTIT